MVAIAVKRLGKAYKQYSNRWHRLQEWLFSITRHRLKWVLREVTFDLAPGDAVAVIGANGAGKSTLLKMITGTVQPTYGSIETHGRVAALLELGMGFHPDFTGRQNVMMAGQLQGIAAEELNCLMTEIEAFADIPDYIDQPVRVYSSGMQVRLAFSVATAIRPAVLIVDEALSVGDAAFQRKCFQRIEAFREAGTALLFVSHDIESVKRLCSRAVYLRQGEVIQVGPAKEVCDAYERDMLGASLVVNNDSSSLRPGVDAGLTHIPTNAPFSFPACAVHYGNGIARILRCWIEGVDGVVRTTFRAGERIIWRYEVEFTGDCAEFFYGMMIKTKDGVSLYGTNTLQLGSGCRVARTGDVDIVSFALDPHLGPGEYFLNGSVAKGSTRDPEFLHRIVDAAILIIEPVNDYPSGLIAMDVSARIGRQGT